MKTGRKVSEFEFNFKSFFLFIEISLEKPRAFAEKVSKYTDLKKAVLFLILNFIIGSIIFILGRVFLYNNFYLLFPTISEMLFLMPFFILFFLILVLTMFIVSKILGGKGSFKSSLIVSSYSSLPLSLVSIPLIKVFALAWFLILLIFSYREIHNYDISKASLNIILPILTLILLMIMTNTFSLNLIFS